MRALSVLLCFTFCTVLAHGQMKVDTTRTSVSVTQTVAGVPKTLSIFRSYVPGQGLRYQAVYQPTAADVGQEPEVSGARFSDEAPHLKAMLDAAIKRKQIKMSRLSVNMMQYVDVSSRLVELYIKSAAWNDYLKKAGAQLYRTIELMDGSSVTEISYDVKVASAVFDSSDLLTELNALFAPYGYKVISGGFPEEHQQTVSTDKLMMLGKNPNLFIPVPNMFYNLVPLKK